MLATVTFCSGFALNARSALTAPRAGAPQLSLDIAPPPGFEWGIDLESSAPAAVAPVAPESLSVLPDAAAVGAALVERVEAAAAKALEERGHFALAIPGGSVLKMLAGSSPSWASKCTLAYVNHKAVPMDDAELATHAKANALFLSEWAGANVLVMGGSPDAAAEAVAYEEAMKALPAEVLPRDAAGRALLWPLDTCHLPRVTCHVLRE